LMNVVNTLLNRMVNVFGYGQFRLAGELPTGACLKAMLRKLTDTAGAALVVSRSTSHHEAIRSRALSMRLTSRLIPAMHPCSQELTRA
jgi:hypothetical protein